MNRFTWNTNHSHTLTLTLQVHDPRMSVLAGLLRNRYSAPSLPDFEHSSIIGKTVLVTGASGGLGLEAARHYVRLGASRVILAVRSQSKGDAARQNILSSVKAEGKMNCCAVEVWIVELASFGSVAAFANRAMKELGTLDIAVLNAGVSNTQYKLTDDGWEETLQVNHLSTVLLALLLLPKLRQSSGPDFTSRLSIVASRSHQYVKGNEVWLDSPNSLEALNKEDYEISPSSRYGASKLLLIYAVREIAKLVIGKDGKCAVIVNYLCPGACKSDLARDWNQSLARRAALGLIQATICKTAEEGGRTLVFATELGPESHGLWIHNDRIEESVLKHSSLPR